MLQMNGYLEVWISFSVDFPKDAVDKRETLKRLVRQLLWLQLKQTTLMYSYFLDRASVAAIFASTVRERHLLGSG
jgi:hypothetical protein